MGKVKKDNINHHSPICFDSSQVIRHLLGSYPGTEDGLAQQPIRIGCSQASERPQPFGHGLRESLLLLIGSVAERNARQRARKGFTKPAGLGAVEDEQKRLLGLRLAVGNDDLKAIACDGINDV